MKLQSMILPTHNGITAGQYEWFTSRAEAEKAAFPGSTIVETSPGSIWRALTKPRPNPTHNSGEPNNYPYCGKCAHYHAPFRCPECD